MTDDNISYVKTMETTMHKAQYSKDFPVKSKHSANLRRFTDT